MSQTVKIKYNKEATYYEKWMHMLNYVQSMQKYIESLDLPLPDNAKILDLGCGTGLASVVLRKKYPNAKIIGLDFSQAMLSICHKKLPNMQLILGDYNKWNEFTSYPEGSTLKFQPNEYDLIISTGSLSEYGEVEKVLPKLKNLLKPGGILLNIGIKKGIIGWIQSKLWHFNIKGKPYFINECKKSGFNQIKTVKIPFRLFPTSFIKYGVKATK